MNLGGILGPMGESTLQGRGRRSRLQDSVIVKAIVNGGLHAYMKPIRLSSYDVLTEDEPLENAAMLQGGEGQGEGQDEPQSESESEYESGMEDE